MILPATCKKQQCLVADLWPMPASFAYGRRHSRLVHIHELDERQDRGLKCGCLCPKCGRPLQAHLGAQKAWHFQHHVEDASCNPQPMTLLHEFVRDELATKKALRIPAVKLLTELHVFDEPVVEFVTVPAEELVFKTAHAELRGDGVQPDVVFERDNGVKLALEVRYSHAVDEEKLQRLKSNYHTAVEFDVSDLPASGITREQLEVVLAQSRRWKWLVNAKVVYAESRARLRLEWAKTVWRAGTSSNKKPEVRQAVQKLKQAKRRLPWAETALTSIKHQGLGVEDAALWLGEQHKTDRVAIACAALRLDPERLPAFMQQFLPKDKPVAALGHHPYSWQPPVFMKFCVGRRSFTPHEAAEWAVKAMPDRCEHEDGTKSLNGFTRTAAALHHYFLQLEAQGLLVGSPYVAREERTFTPKFATVAALQGHLDVRSSAQAVTP